MQKHSVRIVSPHLHASCFTLAQKSTMYLWTKGEVKCILEGEDWEASVIEGNLMEQVITLERIFP